MSLPRLALLSAALISSLLLALVAHAHGERAKSGDLIVTLDGGLSPRRLPRHRPAPVSIELTGTLKTTDREPLPQLRQIELGLAGRQALQTRGLPRCPRRALRADTPAGAMRLCGDALVGRGHLEVAFYFPEQRPYGFQTELLAFNGRLANGAPAIWLHAYGPNPPSSFVIPFVIRRAGGDFPTRLTARIPRDLGPLPHVANFAMRLGRRFEYRGRPRSYLNARCPLPPRFTAFTFPLARATYRFTDGTALGTTIARGCRVAPHSEAPVVRDTASPAGSLAGA